MLKKRLNKEKPRVFLGVIAVVPRTNITKVDEWGMFQSEDLASALCDSLFEIFSLPAASSVNNLKESDFVIDVIIQKYQSGDIWSVDLGEIGSPIFWRPKVEVRSRIYELATNRKISIFSAVENEMARFSSALTNMESTPSLLANFLIRQRLNSCCTKHA